MSKVIDEPKGKDTESVPSNIETQQTLTITATKFKDGSYSLVSALPNGKAPMQTLELIAEMESKGFVKPTLLNLFIGKSSNGKLSDGICNVLINQVTHLRTLAKRVLVASSMGSDQYR